MKLERLLAIVMLLVNRRRMQAQELADRLEVSVRTIYRDIEAINQAGIPVVTFQGAGGGIGIADGFRMDRNFLTSDELAAVFVALKGAAVYRDDRAAAALEKLRSLVPIQQAGAIEAKTEHVVLDLGGWGGSPAQQEKLRLLRGATESSRTIAFTYTTATGEAIRRDADPHVLILKGQTWYLYAWCHMRQAFRLFRLSRMKEIAILERTFVRREISTTEPAPWEQEWRRPNQKTVDLVLRFDPQVRALVEDWFGPDGALPDESGRLVGSVSFPEDDWVYGFILSFGARVEVLSPPHVRERIAAMAGEIQATYRRSEPSIGSDRRTPGGDTV